MTTFDTVIKGGQIVDGLRTPRYQADVGIKDGRIAAIGRIPASEADQVLDAEGHIVAPGFVDLHTHYDAQIFWDPYCTISGYHGVTSVVIGNCGYSFAPVAPELRDRTMRSMTRVEQIPYESMKEGLPWNWETFPEFLDALDGIPKGVNVLPYAGLNPFLVQAMGLDAAKSRHATDDEIREVARLVNEAMEAGACGWSAQRTPPTSSSSGQRDFDGTPFPSDVMSNETALALCQVLADRNEGFIQSALQTDNVSVDRAHYEEMAAVSGRPIIYNGVTTLEWEPEVHRRQLAWLDRCREKGLRIYGQGVTSDAGLSFTLKEFNLWDAHEPWRISLLGDTAERLEFLADPAMRERLKADMPRFLPLDTVILLRSSDEANNRFENLKMSEIADITGKHMVDAFLDMAVGDDLETLYWTPFSNTDEGLHRELLVDPFVILGISDGGAHTKMFTGGKYPTEHIELYVRERGWVSLEEMHWKLSTYPAWVAGFKDRGTLVEGAPADIVVYDYENLRCLPDEIVHDLPAGEWRRVQRAEGYRYILVNGEVTFEDGKCTGAVPGTLLRHGRG